MQFPKGTVWNQMIPAANSTRNYIIGVLKTNLLALHHPRPDGLFNRKLDLSNHPFRQRLRWLDNQRIGTEDDFLSH